MKKYFLVGLLFLMTLFIFPREGTSNETVEPDIYQVIPDEAIRLRILANSDNETDQKLKHEVRDAVNEQISGWVEHLTSIEAAREMIESRIKEVEATVSDVLAKQNNNSDLLVEYGKKVSFPLKLYDTFVYPAGEYEAVLITLGEGQGSNWWCVLFPPLCFLDFSMGATVGESADKEAELVEESDTERVKVKFFLFEWLGWA